ncbi:LuxR C-terminal-related transcriptional regulator [Nocardia sp. CDC153]|uniref:LuxR C-terminal-related transcriptional regulator n=1 Tax=Nocardia sp. CDC153 TaxID=3112167 RepID=UPI002DB946B3|nr:LuxR C-terminal-related transcriptional regulator [Nocardia sp. CDC153]MEC3957280.1 LuxR C-terminal-related transcriptional regulator [Nocardia sp. CDC153]
MARRVNGNLPEEVTSFVGRREELATAKRLLPTTRVLTLLGPGGMGKTRLSRQIGQLVSRAFPDGVWLVELADVQDPALVTLAVTEALDLRDESTAPLPRLTEFLADKRLLLILDNCEHLIEACAALVGRIIATTPDVRVLATSREVLGIPGEQVMPVPPLTVPETAGEDGDALQLFVERATAANPGFQATPANRAVLAEICRRLEGMPLALELAALRLRMFTPEQILDRLDDTIGLLSAGPRTAPQRQQTIEGAIRWSYDLCTGAEQSLWEQLSVFAGGFDIDAAEAVCELGSASLMEALTGLVDKSVVMLRFDGDVARYSMLEPIRQFAADRLAERGAAHQVRARHREHYRQLAMRGQTAYWTAEDVAWFGELSREHANLRAALKSGLEDEPLRTMATVTVLRPFWEHNRFLSEGYRWLTDSLARNPEATAERAKALSSAASLAALLGDEESASRLVGECMELAAALGDTDIMAEVALDRSLLAFANSDRERSLELGRSAIELAASHGQNAIEMDSHAFSFMAAMVLEAPGRTELAERFLKLTSDSGSHLLGGLALWTVGIDHWRRGELEASAAFHSRAIEQLALFERCIWLSSAFEGLAWTVSAGGDYERAARLLGAAETLQRSTIRLAHTITVAVGEKERLKVREALGEEAFRAAFGAGASLPLEEAIDYALGRTPAAPEPLAAPPALQRAPRASTATLSETNVLTRRQKDVARLVAAGHSNKRIAADLVISVRTAETHVEHILTKLGLTSRTQLAAWAHEHDL